MRVPHSLLAGLGLLAVACSSSSSGSSIVGEWSTPVGTGGKATEDWFFNSDGTCGVVVMQNGTSVCSTGCKYTFNGTALDVTTSTTTNGATTSTTYDETVAFENGGSTASVTGGCDSSVCLAVTYTRINSNSSNACP
jgi:hypothetical protein